jgi:hypothetical protein
MADDSGDDLARWLSGRTFVRNPRADPSRSAWAYAEGGAGEAAFGAKPQRGGEQAVAFQDDGTFRMTVAGPDDRPTTMQGTWQVDPGAAGRAELRFNDGRTVAVTREPNGRLIVDYGPQPGAPKIK